MGRVAHAAGREPTRILHASICYGGHRVGGLQERKHAVNARVQLARRPMP